MNATVTQHAIKRYMERSGTTRPMRSALRLHYLMEHAVKLDADRYYAMGWIMVVVKGILRTVYRPRHRRDMEAIHRLAQRRLLTPSPNAARMRA